MFTTPLLQRLKLRHKLAALGVVGMAACLFALLQVLRWQGLELQRAESAQDALAPAIVAVSLQRGLVDHRDSAARLLRREPRAEAQRRGDQAVVDAHMAMLEHRLQFTALWPARRELDAMRTDWPKLVQKLVTARCSVAESHAAHRLLIEQTLTIIDVVSLAQDSSGNPGPALADALPLRQALAAARATLPLKQDEPAQWAALFDAAQTQVQQTQAQRLAVHQAHRAMAASGMLALVAGLVGVLSWLGAALRSARRLPAVPPSAQARAARPEVWQAPAPEARQAGRSLFQRLRGPAPAPTAPLLDQPTEPQAL